VNCGDEECPACPPERPAAAALRRWVEEQARVNARIAELLAERQRRRAPPWVEVQRGLGVAGFVPKRDKDDS
jgi:hypothetical protein